MATASITDRPIYPIGDSSPAVSSRWIAAWNPIMYTFSFTGIDDTIAYLIVYIYEYGSNTLLGKSTYHPRGNTLRVDISHEVRSYLYSEFLPDFTQGEPNSVNANDEGSTLKCYLKYQLVTIQEGNTLAYGDLISDESNFIYCTNSAKQLGEPYGQNMALYVPYGIDTVMKAKFLTKFDEPVYYPGYPFTISFIYSEYIVGHEIFLTEAKKDLNGNALGSIETELLRQWGHSINQLKLQDSFASNVAYVDINLTTGQPTEDFYVESGYVEEGYTEAR
jgi:hypothetical protein